MRYESPWHIHTLKLGIIRARVALNYYKDLPVFIRTIQTETGCNAKRKRERERERERNIHGSRNIIHQTCNSYLAYTHSTAQHHTTHTHKQHATLPLAVLKEVTPETVLAVVRGVRTLEERWSSRNSKKRTSFLKGGRYQGGRTDWLRSATGNLIIHNINYCKRTCLSLSTLTFN